MNLRAALWGAAALLVAGLLTFHVRSTREVEVPADHAEATLRVDGMHCGVYCPIRVGEALKDVDGLYRTFVDVSRGEVTVQFDAARAAPEDFAVRLDRHPDYRARVR